MNRTATSDLLKHTLTAIPSIFGKLVYLSGLRNTESGRYEHYGLTLVFGDKDAEKALRTSHQKAFQDWLSHNLQQQKSDLDLYFASLLGEPRAVVSIWLEKTAYIEFVPNNSRLAERQLFSADLAALLSLFKNEYAGLPIHPTAWQHR